LAKSAHHSSPLQLVLKPSDGVGEPPEPVLLAEQ
jgi:hypothetical protein